MQVDKKFSLSILLDAVLFTFGVLVIYFNAAGDIPSRYTQECRENSGEEYENMGDEYKLAYDIVYAFGALLLASSFYPYVYIPDIDNSINVICLTGLTVYYLVLAVFIGKFFSLRTFECVNPSTPPPTVVMKEHPFQFSMLMVIIAPISILIFISGLIIFTTLIIMIVDIISPKKAGIAFKFFFGRCYDEDEEVPYPMTTERDEVSETIIEVEHQEDTAEDESSPEYKDDEGPPSYEEVVSCETMESNV